MKKLTFFLTFLISVSVAAQKKQVPDTILQAFSNKYPNGYYSNEILVEISSGKEYYKISLDNSNAIISLEIDEDG
ncbi:MAG: hypothetical protein JSV09_06160 [Thermoplasmata archaeon]|nr:MAG: hypothetical protein JSV09_06160 [Thermoplasmata archaeon]